MTVNTLKSSGTLWFIGTLIAVLFLATNLPWELDDYDQAKQAYTSFEMINAGHWFYQHTPHQHVATKPPLVGWISSAFFAVTRSWEVAWRLPSLLAAIALSILLFRTASAAFGPSAGLIALSAFGLNLLTPRLATLVRTDMPLAFTIFAIGLLIWQKIRSQTPWTGRDRLLICAFLTAAMLIKGPVVYAFLLPGMVVAAACNRHQHWNGWCGWWPWLVSLAIFLLWAGGGILFQPGFYDQVVLREFLGRLGETIHRPQPIYFYLPHLLHKFAPWSLLMIALAIANLQSRQWNLRVRQISPEILWLICWIMGGLIVMSLIPSKRVDRIFPVIPPLCLLLAAQIAPIPENETAHKRICFWSAIALGLSILFIPIYTGLKISAGYRQHRGALVEFAHKVRIEVDKNHWRCQVLSTGDEGLLLYLRRLYFVTPEEAVTEWNNGNIDALVVPENAAPSLLPRLRDAAPVHLRSEPAGNDTIVYVLLSR
jgi:4-amino-4-deoxy-L-arabinose transferase-like glycosyltransferase